MVIEGLKSYLKILITENEAERKHDEFNVIRDKKYIKATNELLDNVKHLYKGREKIIEGFKNGIFPLMAEDFHSDGENSDSPAIPDPNIDESYDLTDRELQMFFKTF